MILKNWIISYHVTIQLFIYLHSLEQSTLQMLQDNTHWVLTLFLEVIHVLCICHLILSSRQRKYDCNPPWSQLPPLGRLLPNKNLCFQLLFWTQGSYTWLLPGLLPQDVHKTPKHLNLRWPKLSFPSTNLLLFLPSPSSVSGPLFLLAPEHATQATSFLMSKQLWRPVLPPLYFSQLLLFPHFLSNFSSDLLITSHLD